MILGREDLKPFKAWFQKTLPLVYDDSLTYQELLYKLIAKINEVVESQNQTNENFDELYALFVQLKDYVDNYFKNLDVQKEINNKLDEMAADGTLESIVAKYLKYQLVVNPEGYGAVGDGVTNDAAAFKKMFTDAQNNGYIIKLTKPKYNVVGIGRPYIIITMWGDTDKTTLLFGENDALVNNGSLSLKNIVFECETTGTSPIISYNQVNQILEIENCDFINNAATDSKRYAIAIRALNNLTVMKNISIVGFESGIIFSGSKNIGKNTSYVLDNITIKNSQTGIDFEGYTATNPMTGSLKNVAISNIYFENTEEQKSSIETEVGSDAILISAVENFSISNVISKHARERAIYVNVCRYGSISNVYSEHSDTIKVAGEKNNTSSFISINNVDSLQPELGSLFDCYYTNYLTLNNARVYCNINSDSMIRIRNYNRELILSNIEINGGYRTPIAFESETDDDTMTNITLKNIRCYNVRTNVAGPVIEFKNDRANWIYDLCIDGFSLNPNNNFYDVNSNVTSFINANNVNGISISNAVLRGFGAGANLMSITGPRSSYNNIEILGANRNGSGTFGTPAEANNLRSYASSSSTAYRYNSYAVFNTKNNIISYTTNMQLRVLRAGVQYILDDSISYMFTVSGTKNGTYYNDNGSITKITGDDIISGSGLNLPVGVYEIVSWAI